MNQGGLLENQLTASVHVIEQNQAGAGPPEIASTEALGFDGMKGTEQRLESDKRKDTIALPRLAFAVARRRPIYLRVQR